MSKFYTSVALSGDSILVREVDSNGKHTRRKVKYKPTLFVADKSNRRATGDERWTTIFNEPVKPMHFESIKEARNFVQQYKDVDHFTIYGLQKWQYAWLNEEYPGQVDFDSSLLNTGSLDIETARDEKGFGKAHLGDKPITLITISRRNPDEFHTFGYKDFVNDDPEVTYHRCENEVDMLLQFLRIWEKMDYDVITTWNGDRFDIPYIINRIINLLGEDQAKRLSPWKQLRTREVKEKYGKTRVAWTIVGLAHLDYLALYQKFTQGSQESYTLDNIAFVELGRKKLSYAEFQSLQDLYERDFDLYTRYNIRDVRLVDEIDDKKKLIDLALTIAYMTKINYEDALTTVTLWDIKIHNYLWERKQVVPPPDPHRIDRSIEGAYVKDPEAGFFKNVVSFDVTSLYPSLIIQYNISPEKYAGMRKVLDMQEVVHGGFQRHGVTAAAVEDDVAVCATGLSFKRDSKGFLPTLVDAVFQDRQIARRRMGELEKAAEKCSDPVEKAAMLKEAGILDNKQQALKININALYGALANYTFRWFRAEFAESITLTGQMVIRTVEARLSKKLSERFGRANREVVVAVDTDSNYVELGESFTKDNIQDTIDGIDEFVKSEVDPWLEEIFQDIARDTNAYVERIKMKREVIATEALWTGKKHYAMNVWDKEGVRYSKPKVKIMGLEAVKSSTAYAAREGIKEAISTMLDKEQVDLYDFVDKFYFKFVEMAADEIAKPTSCQGLSMYSHPSTIYVKGTPYHVKAALIYNDMLAKTGLDAKYEQIADGDKVKIINLIQPNPAFAPRIAFKGFLPEELGLHPYIDAQEQYTKMFLNPIRSLAGARGWNAERLITVDEAF